MDILHQSFKAPLLYPQGPNVNAIYGPWEDTDQALEKLNEFYIIRDPFGGQSEVNIPVGSTVAIYKNAEKTEVTEYWYSNNQLVVKSFEDNYHKLEITDENGNEVDQLVQEQTVLPSILYVKKISPEDKPIEGELFYSVDGGSEWKFDSQLDIRGLDIKKSLNIYWRDAEYLISNKTLKLVAGHNLEQKFYLNYNEELLPKEFYSWPSDIESAEYQKYDWTPNVGKDKEDSWTKENPGILPDRRYLFLISRERINGHWENPNGPSCIGVYGKDGVSTYRRQAIYTLTDNYNENFEDETEWLLSRRDEWSNVDDIETIIEEINESSYCRTYCSELNRPSVGPTNKYLWMRARDSYSENGKDFWGPFSNASIYINWAEDGKDSDIREYIYCRTTEDELSTEQLREFEDIKTDTAQCAFDELSNPTLYTHWSDDANGVGYDKETLYKVEYCSIRDNTSQGGIITYGEWSDPFKWAVLGEPGQDGAGVEYIYILTKTKEAPVISTDGRDESGKTVQDDEYLPKGWSDDYLQVTYEYQHLWQSHRKGSAGNWSDFSDPVLVNMYQAQYRLVLENQQTIIPADLDGYTKEAARQATSTRITLFRGGEEVPQEQYKIEYPKEYYYDNEYYYINTTNINFAGEQKLYKFVAKDLDGAILDSAFQSVQLVINQNSYKLQITPNTRIWYGGNNYSVDYHQVSVYKLDASGKQTTDSIDLNSFWISCTPLEVGGNTTNVEINSNPDTLDLPNCGGLDVVVSLIHKKTSQVLDTQTIATVDYSTIKGEDSDGYVLTIDQEYTNIPYKKRNDSAYLNTVLSNKLSVYKNTELFPISKIELLDESYSRTEDGKYWLNYTDSSVETPNDVVMSAIISSGNVNLSIQTEEIQGNIVIPITVCFNVDGSEMKLTKNWTITLGSDVLDTYNIFVEPQVLHWYPNATSFDVEQVVIEAYNSSQGYKVEEELGSKYEIIGHHVNKSGESTLLGSSIYNGDYTFNLDGVYELCQYGNNDRLEFTLLIDGQPRAQNYIDVIYQQQDIPNRFTIDLNNPIVKLPKGVSEDVTEQITQGIAYVYSNNVELPYGSNPEGYSYKIKWGGIEFTSNTYSFKKVYTENSSETLEFIIYNKQEEICTINKTVLIQIVDEVTYQFTISPSTYVCEFGETPDTSNSTIYIKKIVPDVGIIDINTKELYDSEVLTLKSGETEITIKEESGLKVESLPTDGYDHITLDLYKDNVWQDSDEITILHNGRNGQDSEATKYIYGKYQNEATREELLNIASEVSDRLNDLDLITKLKDKSYVYLTKQSETWIISETDSGEFKITDDPEGVSATRPFEFISKATLDINGTVKGSWSKFALFSAYGENGSDGPGLEYIYLACCQKVVIEDGNLSQVATYSSATSSIVSLSQDERLNPNWNYTKPEFQNPDASNPYWQDDIPELTFENPYLYVCTRKYKNGVWSKYSNPVLWDTYNANLDFSLDNDQIIIDDNTEANAFELASTTKFAISFGNNEIVSFSENLQSTLDSNVLEFTKDNKQYQISVYFSESLSDKIKLSTVAGNEFKFTFAEGVSSLKLGTSGQITYSLAFDDQVVTKNQKVQVFNFSSGEMYSLVVSPNSIDANKSENSGAYQIQETNLKFHINKISSEGVQDILVGTNNQSISEVLGDFVQIKLNSTDITSKIKCIGNEFQLHFADYSGKIDDNKCNPLEIQLYIKSQENYVLVDQETISFSKQGETGSFDTLPDSYAIITNTNYVYYDQQEGNFNVDYIEAWCQHQFTNEIVAGSGCTNSDSQYVIIYHVPEGNGAHKIIAISTNEQDDKGKDLVYFKEEGISTESLPKPTAIEDALKSETLRNNYNTIYIDCIDKQHLKASDLFNGSSVRNTYGTKGIQRTIEFRTNSIEYDIQIQDNSKNPLLALQHMYYYGLANITPNVFRVVPVSITKTGETFAENADLKVTKYFTSGTPDPVEVPPLTEEQTGEKYYLISLGSYQHLTSDLAYISIELLDGSKVLASKILDVKRSIVTDTITATSDKKNPSLTINGVELLSDSHLQSASNNGYPLRLGYEDIENISELNGSYVVISEIDPKKPIYEGGLAWEVYDITKDFPNKFVSSSKIVVFQTVGNVSYTQLESWFGLFQRYGADTDNISEFKDYLTSLNYSQIGSSKLSVGEAVQKVSTAEATVYASYVLDGLLTSQKQYKINLTNDFDFVVVDSYNKTNAKDISTTVELFRGTDKVEIKSISATCDVDGITPKCTDNVVSINIVEGMDLSDKKSITCTITVEDNDGYKDSILFIIRVTQNPVYKQLVPSVTSIVVNKDGGCIPNNVSCMVYNSSIQNSYRPTKTEENGFTKAEVFYNVNGGWMPYTDGIEIKKEYTEVKFALMPSPRLECNPDYAIDIETIPVIHDGEDGQVGPRGSSGLTVRTFYGMDAGTTYRDESATITKYEYSESGFQEDNSPEKDPLFYKDYVVFINDDGTFNPYVCKKTFYCEKDITSGNLKDYTSDDSPYIGKTFNVTSGNITTSDIRFNEAFEAASNLGNSFFQTLSAISGDIRQLSSSILRIHGQLLVHKPSEGNETGEVQGGINGVTNNDPVNNVSKDIIFWSGGTGTETGDLSNPYKANFAVTKEGTLYANKGVFKGLSGGVNVSQPRIITPKDLQFVGVESYVDITDKYQTEILNLSYYLDPIKTGLNVIMNDYLIEDLPEGYNWGYGFILDTDKNDYLVSVLPKDNFYIDTRGYIVAAINDSFTDTLIDNLISNKVYLSPDCICIYKTTGNQVSYKDSNKYLIEVNSYSGGEIKVTVYVDLPGYNNEFLGSQTSDYPSYNYAWPYYRRLINGATTNSYSLLGPTQSMQKYMGYCDQLLDQTFRIRCCTNSSKLIVNINSKLSTTYSSLRQANIKQEYTTNKVKSEGDLKNILLALSACDQTNNSYSIKLQDGYVASDQFSSTSIKNNLKDYPNDGAIIIDISQYTSEEMISILDVVEYATEYYAFIQIAGTLYTVYYNEDSQEYYSQPGTPYDYISPKIDIKFRGIPRLGLSGEIFQGVGPKNGDTNFVNEFSLTSQVFARTTLDTNGDRIDLSQIYYSIPGDKLITDFIKVSPRDILTSDYFYDVYTYSNNVNLLGTIKSKFGITEDNAWNGGLLHNALHISYLNGIDTWDNIDESTIVGPEEHMISGTLTNSNDPNLTYIEQGKMYYTEYRYRPNRVPVNYKGIDIIAKCMRFSEAFGGKYISDSEKKVLSTRSLGFDGGIVWIPSYIGGYTSRLEGECENPISSAENVQI